MKDLLTVVSATLIGLVAFMAYLTYAAKFLFFVALAYLTYSFLKSLRKHDNAQQPATMQMNDAGLSMT